MFQKGRIRTAFVLGAAVTAVAVGLIAPSIASGASTPNTITIAEGANATPNYILPFYPGSQCTVANTSQFQQ